MNRIDLITLFPGMASGVLQESIIGRAVAQGLFELNVHDLRDWSKDKHHTVDDRPFGGGAGMLLKPEPLFSAVEELRNEKSQVVYLCPDGDILDQPIACSLARCEHLILISGHYEGIDQRVREALVHREISIGNYVLTNGTLPALVLIDCVCRYLPGVLGDEKSLTQDSFHDKLLGFPQYTRPDDYCGMKVPEILLSGNHQAIAKWREQQQIEKTRLRRPNLIS